MVPQFHPAAGCSSVSHHRKQPHHGAKAWKAQHLRHVSGGVLRPLRVLAVVACLVALPLSERPLPKVTHDDYSPAVHLLLTVAHLAGRAVLHSAGARFDFPRRLEEELVEECYCNVLTIFGSHPS